MLFRNTKSNPDADANPNLNSAPLLFGSKSTISRFGERFRDGQYSLVSLLLAVLLLTVPPFPAICKSGGTCHPWPMESAPLAQHIKFNRNVNKIRA